MFQAQKRERELWLEGRACAKAWGNEVPCCVQETSRRVFLGYTDDEQTVAEAGEVDHQGFCMPSSGIYI